jgi:hypothetical protein
VSMLEKALESGYIEGKEGPLKRAGALRGWNPRMGGSGRTAAISVKFFFLRQGWSEGGLPPIQTWSK